MGIRQILIDWLAAGRTKNEPDRQTEAYSQSYGWWTRSGNAQPVPKRTPTNLRTLSESPIPRRAINVIKNGITKLNWTVAAIDENDTEKYKDICKTIERSLLKPNSGDSFRSWLEQIVEDMLVGSAGSSEIQRAGDPLRPFRMYPVDTFTVELFPQWDGKPNSYRFAQRVSGNTIPLKASEMMYIRMNPRTNTPFGLSPLEVVWESATNFIETHRSGGKQTKSTFMRKLLNLGKSSSPKAADAFMDFWANEVMGQGKMPIVSGFEGTSVLDLGATDDKALFIEWQRFLIEIVALAFDISPKKLGQTKDVNRSTADSEDEDTESTVQSIAENIVEHINNQIIDGMFGMGDVLEFKFHYATSLKDLKTQADIDAIYLDRRVDTPDEVRDKRGKKALPNQHGEVLLQPSKLEVIDINSTQEELAATKDPPPEPPEAKPNKEETNTEQT
ncbi:HK97 family phage portal protein [Paenibacillus sp. PastF-3]|uniref:phage portal protein n=1 Tax=Paenibacillus sp. PastF-3 TaxID=2940626 RepID=UPI002476AF0D|nr:phage portal protein [Paenibacillus sp. PastF-3]MDH6373543.1 HK97 family phage portal protein [Paenibacillus sp. PastF-3]